MHRVTVPRSVKLVVTISVLLNFFYLYDPTYDLFRNAGGGAPNIGRLRPFFFPVSYYTSLQFIQPKQISQMAVKSNQFP